MFLSSNRQALILLFNSKKLVHEVYFLCIDPSQQIKNYSKRAMWTCGKKTIKFMYRWIHILWYTKAVYYTHYICWLMWVSKYSFKGTVHSISMWQVQFAKVFLKAIPDQELILYSRFLFIKPFFQLRFI